MMVAKDYRRQPIPGRHDIPGDIKLFILIQAALAAALLLCVRFYLHRGYRDPVHDWPLAGFRYGWDFAMFIPRFAYVHQLNFFAPEHGLFPYPSPVGLVYALFYAFPRPQFLFFVILTLIPFGLFGVWEWQALCARGLSRYAATTVVAAVTFLSYPFWFEYLGGNMELIVFLLVAGGLIAFLHGKEYPAAVLFGIAASMKLFPVILFGLFLSRRRFRPVFLGAATIVAFTVFSLWFLCPSISIAWHQNNRDLRILANTYFFSISPLASFDHSLLSAYRDVFGHITHRPINPIVLSTYTWGTAFAGVALFVAFIRQLPVVNQICALTIAAIWLPPTSIDYTLLHLFVPIGLLMLLSVEAWREGRTIPGLRPALICGALLISPQNEIIRHDNGCGGLIKATIFLVLFILVLRYPFRSSDPSSLLA